MVSTNLAINKPEHNSQKFSDYCVIVGHSIEAITTATVMASLGYAVKIYSEHDALAHTLENYSFEYQQQALWQLYISQQQIHVLPIVDKFTALYTDDITDIHTLPALLWLFYNDLPEQWVNKIDETDTWVISLNESNLPSKIPVILSGTSTLGMFADIAKHCHRPWVYYIPFVFIQSGPVYASMLSPELWLMGEKTTGSSDKLFPLQPLIAQAKQKHTADIATIEFSRSAIMSMLATRVSFMNEWSRLADEQGVDITEVSNIMGLDSRIGKSYLRAGWGFGGKSLPNEISALKDTLQNTQVEHRLMQAVNDINQDQKELIFRKFWQYFDGSIEGKSVSIWGASYKQGSGRTSGSAIHPLLHLLWSYRITTYVYAFEAEAELSNLYPDQPLLQFIIQPTDKLDTCDTLFIMSWENTQQLPIASINDVVVPVFDAQNAFSRAQIELLTGDYQGIGRRKRYK